MPNYTEFNFDKVTNTADFSVNVTCEAVGGGTIGLFVDNWQVDVKLYHPCNLGRNDYGHGLRSYGAHQILTASSSDSTLDILTGDIVQWTWNAAQMQILESGTYLISGIATKDIQTIQLFVANLPVIRIA
jgi:hypothetical protein